MIQLKVQLHPMHLHLGKFLAAVLLICLLGGCTEKTWTQRKWFTELAIDGGFSMNESTALRDLDAYGLIEMNEESIDDPLTFQTAVSTCTSLIKGCNAEQLLHVLNSSSLVESDKLSDQQALILLNWIVTELNTFGEQSYQQIIYEREPVKVQNVERNGEWIQCEQFFQLNDLIELDGFVYQIVEINERRYRIEEVDYEDVEEIDISGSMKLNLEDAQFTVRNEVVEMNEVLGAGLPVSRLSKTFEIQGFTVRFSSSSDSLHIYASKKTSSGLPLFVQFDINEINCDFKWKAKQDEVIHSGMKVSYETTLTSGFRTAKYSDRVLDFSKIDQADLLNSIKNAFVIQTDVLQETLELAEIQLPFPELPACMLKMKVLLHLYASGKAEISFESNHVIGFEKVAGKLRIINESKKDSNVSFRASAKASTQLQFVVSVLGKNCMDAAAEIGIQGNAVSQFYNNETGLKSTNDIPYELAEELVQSSENLLVCADMNAYWLFHLIFNSSKSVLGSFGFGKTFHLIDETNGSLFHGTVHLENFLPVEQCTRKLKNTPLPTIDASSDRIELKHYLLVLDENESAEITVLSLPEGFQYSDVIFSSLDSTIASVDSKGKVRAYQNGQTVIKVALKDGSHEVQCSIFVR